MNEVRRTDVHLSRRGLVVGALGAATIPAADRALARAVDTPATEEDAKFMRLALAEAAKSELPFGAVIIRDDKVLARGHSTQERDPTAHGEMVAIRNFLAEYDKEKFEGTTLYTSGEPCPMCMGAIMWCGIERMVFAASLEQLATKMSLIMVHATEIANKTTFADIRITGGVLDEEALALFK
jgi:tRNA(Arg) A34 adenosine deaminase TadA